METARAWFLRRSAAVRILILGSVGGMLAGMMMAMVEMFYGWANDSRTFWDAPMAIWSWVTGIEHFGEPSNHIGPIILGIGGHMMNGMMLGIAFAALLYLIRPRDDLSPIMLGLVFGLGSWAIMRYGILPLNAGEDDLFTKDIVSPQWVWWFAHVVLGMTAGMVYVGARHLGLIPDRKAESSRSELRRVA